jgi:hypothetical protein
MQEFASAVQSMSAPPLTSDVYLFCYAERVVDLNAEIADRALDLRVAEPPLLKPSRLHSLNRRRRARGMILFA